MDLFLVYAICFGVGLLFTVLSAFAANVFGGHDVGGHGGGGHATAGHDAHADLGTAGHAEAGYNMPGFSAFSPTVIASFITGFGGFGLIFSKIEATKSPWISAPLSLLIGFLIAALVLWFFRTVFNKVQSSSESRVGSLLGAQATIITPIQENGVGEIAYVQLGTRYTAPARSEHNRVIRNGQAVRITRIVGSQFYVDPD